MNFAVYALLPCNFISTSFFLCSSAAKNSFGWMSRIGWNPPELSFLHFDTVFFGFVSADMAVKYMCLSSTGGASFISIRLSIRGLSLLQHFGGSPRTARNAPHRDVPLGTLLIYAAL